MAAQSFFSEFHLPGAPGGGAGPKLWFVWFQLEGGASRVALSLMDPLASQVWHAQALLSSLLASVKRAVDPEQYAYLLAEALRKQDFSGDNFTYNLAPRDASSMTFEVSFRLRPNSRFGGLDSPSDVVTPTPTPSPAQPRAGSSTTTSSSSSSAGFGGGGGGGGDKSSSSNSSGGSSGALLKAA
eukprot:RCo029244